MPVASLGCHLYFWPIVYKSEVPMTLFLEFNFFARMAHGTQETHLLTLFPIYYKRY